MAGDDPRMNALDRIEAHGTKGSIQRVIAYAESKGYTKDSEMWQWADILGFTIELFGTIPDQIEAALLDAVEKHRETLSLAENDLRQRAGGIASAAAQEIQLKVKAQAQAVEAAMGRVEGRTAVAESVLRKTGAELMEAHAKEIRTTIVGVVGQALSTNLANSLRDIEYAGNAVKRIVDSQTVERADVVGKVWFVALISSALTAIVTAVLLEVIRK